MENRNAGVLTTFDEGMLDLDEPLIQQLASLSDVETVPQIPTQSE